MSRNVTSTFQQIDYYDLVSKGDMIVVSSITLEWNGVLKPPKALKWVKKPKNECVPDILFPPQLRNAALISSITSDGVFFTEVYSRLCGVKALDYQRETDNSAFLTYAGIPFHS